MVPLCEIFNDARRNLIGTLLLFPFKLTTHAIHGFLAVYATMGAVSLVIAAYVEIPEVGIFVNDKLLRGNRTSKINSMGLDACKFCQLVRLKYLKPIF